MNPTATAATTTASSIPWALIITVLGTLLVAAIASVIAYLGHRISQSNTKLQVDLGRETARLAATQSQQTARLSAKLTANIQLADMRQEWIKSLREEMAVFQSLCAAIDLIVPSDFAGLSRSGTRIELHMNPDDANYGDLRAAMENFAKNDLDMFAKQTANDDYVRVCQIILKNEWDRLREEVRTVADSEPV